MKSMLQIEPKDANVTIISLITQKFNRHFMSDVNEKPPVRYLISTMYTVYIAYSNEWDRRKQRKLFQDSYHSMHVESLK